MDQIERLVLKQANLYRLQEIADHIVIGAVSNTAPFVLTSGDVKKLHGVAMHSLLKSPGEFRQCEVEIQNSPHQPPSWVEVKGHMDGLCDYVNKNWHERDLVHLAAFVMWRLNWIHPFENGNGRTSRACSYMVLCIKHGGLLPARNSIIEQIMRNREPYYQALRIADVAYERSKSIDAALKPLEGLLTSLLVTQLKANF